LNILDKYQEEDRNKKKYNQALKEAGGDKIEIEHIYFSPFMDSNYYN